MKPYLVSVFIVFVVAGIFTGNGYGAEPMMIPPERGGDPTAILLVKQGIKQFNTGEVKAARDSFELAAEIDPSLSSAAVNARSAAQTMSRNAAGRGGANAVGGGFAEFGLATLSGFIFMVVVAAYEIGATNPYTRLNEKESVERIPRERRWAEAA